MFLDLHYRWLKNKDIEFVPAPFDLTPPGSVGRPVISLIPVAFVVPAPFRVKGRIIRLNDSSARSAKRGNSRNRQFS